MHGAAVAWAKMVGDDLLGEAQRIVLLDEGTLAASGEVEVDVRPDGVELTVSFNTPYAARRHEETDVTPSVPGRQAKYLEAPLKDRLPRYEASLAAAVRKAL